MTAEEVDKIGEVITDLTSFASIIIVEHDMQFIRSIASTVTVFHQGRVLMEDNVDVVMSDPVLREIYLGKKP
jgi:branched-chain amino acid transport system ATP-binding protein/urea transport system ATP-binding protein